MRKVTLPKQASRFSMLFGLAVVLVLGTVFLQQPSPVHGATNGIIAFTRYTTAYEIDTANSDGSNIQTIATDAAEATWSPDGSQIAYINSGVTPNQVFVMNADGSNKTQVSHTAGTSVAEPTWSPDGSKLAFLCDDTVNNQVCTVNADGSNETYITNSTDVWDGPDWSVTNKIAYVCNDGIHAQLCSINPDGSGRTQITSDAIDHVWPRWSKDGSKILYAEQGTLYVYKLAIVNADGTGLQHINTTSTNVTSPSWSPDNTKIIYTNVIDGTDTDQRIYTINVDGTNETAVTPNDGVNTQWPSWQPVVTNDQDGDSVLSSVEKAAPNNGDANNDGIGDFVQANVTSLIDSVTNKYAVLQSNCTSHSGTSIAAAPRQDAGFAYPAGLMNFTLHCASPGATATVTQYFYGLNPDSTYVLRKYNATTGTYQTVTGATITSVTIGGSTVAKVTYQITDGGTLDQDGSANGDIVDPVGIAQPSAAVPNTGLGGGLR